MLPATPSTLPIRIQPLLKLVLVGAGHRRASPRVTILRSRRLHDRLRSA